MEKTDFSELVNIDELQALCESFTTLTGAVTAILDLEGTVLTATGWQPICTRFHRINPETACRCRESDTFLAGQLAQGERYNVYKCKNGLVDVAVPIIIDDQHVANFFTGQFFFSPPDRDFFIKQAEAFGFDRDAYLEALDQVPIFSEAYIESLMEFFTRLTRVIGEMGHARKQIESSMAELQSSKEALQKSTTMLNTVLDTVPQSIFWKDKEGRYLGCNQVFASAAGLKEPTAIVGKTDYDMPWPKAEADAYRADDREVLDTQKPKLHIIEPLQTAEGKRLWIDTSKAPLADETGEPFGVLGVYHDITEKREAEERVRQMEKMNAVGQLAGGIAHDFNNQLAGILGYAEILEHRLEDAAHRQFATDIISATTRAADLTAQLLAFSRKGKHLSVSVDMHHLIDEVCSMLSRSIDKRIEIRQHFEATCPTVLGDPGQLQNMLLNLGLNARDAMAEGGALTFATSNHVYSEGIKEEDLPAGSYLRIGVADSGTGMSPEIRRRIFEPFFTTKEVGQGTGLGLASVYGTIKSHEGSIRVYSEPGHGSEFTLHLPLSQQTAVVEQPVSALERGQGRVLIVDDEPLLMNLGCDLLQELGYEVMACGDPAEALGIYQAEWQSIDLVLLDMIMPTMNGRELFLAMRAVNPQIKAVIASGFSIDGHAQEVLDEGALAFIAKPFRQAELSQTVARALRES